MHQLLNTKFRLIALLSVSALLIVTSSTLSHAATILSAIGPGAGHSPVVKVIVAGEKGNDTFTFMAYQSSFSGGVRVAVGDVNGDGVSDIITGPGAGTSAHIKVIDGSRLGAKSSQLMSFTAYPGFFRNGVYVAVGDVNGDGRHDIIVAPDAGAPQPVRVFDGRDGALLASFFAFGPAFTGGLTVAAGDLNGDGIDDIIVGAQANGHVKVFNGSTGAEIRSFLAFPGFNGGVSVGAADVNNDRFADVIVGAGPGAPGGHVKVFDGQTGQQLLDFFAFDPNFLGGVQVAAGDVDDDKIVDIITAAGPGGGPHVKVFRGIDQVVLDSFLAYEPKFGGGVFVAAAPASAGR